ncbi:transcription factor Adf-1-like [Portunus trituberculatus]|uniref:transcription factor Adf-1-like n=1 Tax=Portunus trituberculatus TaxID=210409 RepID=UPI001E1D20D0|nr:transcription factor Adf-1-like [Portunus trituberculatus]
MLVSLVWTRLRAADMYHPHQSSDGSAWYGWTMEWTKEQKFMLIELYQSHPVLWDPTDPTYKNKVKKLDAWRSISQALAVERAEVEKKMKTLIGQFRREQKKRNAKSGAGTGDAYISTWFAFKSMKFLLTRNRPHPTNDCGIRVSSSASSLVAMVLGSD